MLRVTLFAIVLLLPQAAWADDELPPPVIDVPPGEDVIVPLRKGQPAPFMGQLFDPHTALRWSNWLSQYQLRLDADVRLAKRECRAELDYQVKLIDIEKDRNEKVEEDLRDRLKRSEQRGADLSEEIANPSFWKSLEFGLILGSVVTAGAAVAIGLAAGG